MLSVIILAKNEEKLIKKTIQSVVFADEILVIDDESTDATSEIAKKSGALVLSHASNGNFAQQRNFSMEKAHGDWLLFIDADEQVTPELAKEIQEVVQSSAHEVYYLRRLDFFLA